MPGRGSAGPYASRFDLVIEFGRVVAIICPARLKTAQLTNLYALLPERAGLDHALARRWDCAHVLCAPDWAAAQKRRTPMFRPRN